MAVVDRPVLEPLLDDPDDYRPNSRLAVVADPGGPQGRVDSFCVIVEEIAPGHRVPLHRHPVDELVLVLRGLNEVTLGDETILAAEGSTVFIPAGVAHGQKNVGADMLHIHAIFLGTTIEVEMLERNPAPGTEERAPARAVYDARTGAITAIG